MILTFLQSSSTSNGRKCVQRYSTYIGIILLYTYIEIYKVLNPLIYKPFHIIFPLNKYLCAPLGEFASGKRFSLSQKNMAITI